MDVDWFKAQMRRADKNAGHLADAINRDRTVISHIFKNRRKLTYEDAQAFAKVLGVPLADVMLRGGLANDLAEPAAPTGFAESDASPWAGKPDGTAMQAAALFGAGKPGVDLWRVKTNSMSLIGLISGDFMVVNTLLRDACKGGDIVIAQVYDHRAGTATTLLRRFDPPALVAASPDPADWRTYIVDDVNVLIMGKVTAAWRDYATTR